MIYVVFVCYNKEKDFMRERIKSFFSGVEYELFLVDTSHDYLMNDGEIIPSDKVNQYFEFTGYYYGLKNVMSCLSQLANKTHSILFVNDTIFDSHFTFLFKFQLIDLMKKALLDNSFYGLRESRPHGYIIPTCFFMVCGKKEVLENISFFPKQLYMGSTLVDRCTLDVEELYVGDKEAFNYHINEWLFPKNFFRGWYKALPFKKISIEEYKRKRTTIYLEYSIVGLFESLGLRYMTFDSYFINKLVLINRLYVNVLKLQYRIRSFFL